MVLCRALSHFTQELTATRYKSCGHTFSVWGLAPEGGVSAWPEGRARAPGHVRSSEGMALGPVQVVWLRSPRCPGLSTCAPRARSPWFVPTLSSYVPFRSDVLQKQQGDPWGLAKEPNPARAPEKSWGTPHRHVLTQVHFTESRP